MKAIFRYGLLLLFGLALGACESVSEKMRVIEKSRQHPPEWLTLGPSLTSSPQGVDFVLHKDKVLDLTLGLAQAQKSVLHNFKYQIDQSIFKQVEAATLSQAAATDLHRQISRILEKEVTTANLKDFYYDKVSFPQAEAGLIPEYYRIFAYAHVTNEQRNAITNAVKTYMKSHSNPELRSKSELLTTF